MRRTDEEFKAEVLRRSEDYRTRRKKRRIKTAVICLPVLLCGGALMTLFAGGYGGSATEMAVDNAMSVECMEEPAAAAPEEFNMQSVGKAESDSITAEGAEENGAADDAVVLSIEVVTQPELEEYSRCFTDYQRIVAILDAIQVFYDDPDTVPGAEEIGNCEGMSYRITITEENGIREYTLFNNALCADGETGWLVNPQAYRRLEKLLLADGE